MIVSFRDAGTESLFQDGRGDRIWQTFRRIARRKLVMLDAAARLTDLSSPPANRLEKLKGNRAGQFSIRINDQFRLCFHWIDGHAHDVEIVDYHEG